MNADVNGIKLVYDDTGRGTPVLWIHGFPLDRTVWQPQIGALAAAARHIVPDLRGFGESEGKGDVVTMEQFADDLRGLLDHLGVPRAVLAGLSMGGYVALAFSRKYADRLAGLVLIDTRAGNDTPEAAKMRSDNAARVLREGADPVLKPMMTRLLAASTFERRADVVRKVERMVAAAKPQAVAAALLGMAQRADSTPHLSNIRVPALIVVGEHDVLTPPKDAREMAARIPGAMLVEIPDAGHLANLEQPDLVNQAVREFISGLAVG